jgi:sugar phosphate isomerase/epimerase
MELIVKKISFSTAALFPRDSVESLRLIGAAGFEYAELMPQCFSDVGDAFVSRAAGVGAKVGSVHYPLAMFSLLYNAHPGMCADARDFGRKIVRLCTGLGAGVLVVHPHERGKDALHYELLEKPIIKNILDLHSACVDAGVQLVMENNPRGPGRSPEGLLSYLESFGNGIDIKPMVDTTESCEADEDPVEFLRKVKPAHTHLSDHVGDTKHIPAGDGEIDWKGVRDALAENGYQGLYTLEPLYKHYLFDAEGELKRAHAFISGLVGI